MLNFVLDPSKEGLGKILKKYQELALRYLWEVGEKGVNSRLVFYAVNEQLPDGEKFSRTSFIFFLNRMVDQGVLDFHDATGKGGHQRHYYPLMDEKEYLRNIATVCIESLLKDFPDETKAVLVKLADW